MALALNNAPGPARDIVMMNAGAALWAADVASSLADGIRQAKAALESGAAKAKLAEFVAFTASAAPAASVAPAPGPSGKA
jgi:anthranilate phosphoribosyltransferase